MFKTAPPSFAIMAAFFAAMGTIFFVVGAHEFYRNLQFSWPVIRVTGTVTERYTTVSHGRHGSSTTYHLDYRFNDTGGKTWDCNDSVASQTYYDLSEQGPVPIKYLPNYPDISRVDLPIEDRNHEIMAWMFMALGGAFGGFGWYAFIGLERLIFYRRWLRRCGVRCMGRVDAVEVNTSITINNRNPRYLNYSYTDSTGQKHQDSSQGLSQKQEELWHEGDAIDVYYDPRDYTQSTVAL